MIYDKIENINNYVGAYKNFDKAFNFLLNLDGNEPEGIIPIDGEEVYAMVFNAAKTTPINHDEWETHRNYIDVQYLADGLEKFGVADITEFDTHYGYKKDIEFHQGNETMNILTFKTGEFLILFPNDAHMPSRNFEEGVSITEKRVVVKVRI
ncbi:MAG: YhcH/YjgK/YiaL family protein [Bacillota bacterium]